MRHQNDPGTFDYVSSYPAPKRARASGHNYGNRQKII